MKFKDPKTGEVFEDIETAWQDWCCARNCSDDCAIQKASGILRNSYACREYCENHPAEAACLMGYEVVEDESTVAINADKDESLETNIDKQKPLKDWTLGEVKEWCARRTAGFKERGRLEEECDECKFNTVCAILVSDWNLTDKPRFTPEEVADARAIMRLFPTANRLFRRDGMLFVLNEFGTSVAIIDENLFPVIQHGESYVLSDIVGGDA